MSDPRDLALLASMRREESLRMELRAVEAKLAEEKERNCKACALEEELRAEIAR